MRSDSAWLVESGAFVLGAAEFLGAYALSLQALENHGNYFTLHKQVMDRGLICPVLVRSYSVYAIRGLLSDLTPARDSVFFYSTGKSLENAKIA